MHALQNDKEKLILFQKLNKEYPSLMEEIILATVPEKKLTNKLPELIKYGLGHLKNVINENSNKKNEKKKEENNPAK